MSAASTKPACGTRTVHRYGNRLEQHFHCADLPPAHYLRAPCPHAPDAPRLTLTQMCNELQLSDDDRKKVHL